MQAAAETAGHVRVRQRLVSGMRIQGVQLPDDGTGDVPMAADLYFDAQNAPNPAPLVVFLPGFAGKKELYTMAGKELSRAGYVTLVVEQLRATHAPWVVNTLVRLAIACPRLTLLPMQQQTLGCKCR